VREPIARAGVELLRSSGFDVVEDATSDLGSIVGDVDALVVRSGTVVDAALIQRAERLKVIGRAGRIARALRTVVRASASRDRRRVVLEIVE